MMFNETKYAELKMPVYEHIRILYAQNWEAEKILLKMTGLGIDAFFRSCKSVPNSISVEELNGREEFADLLVPLPIETLVAEFGEEIALWAAINAPPSERVYLIREIAKETGRNAYGLIRAFLVQEEHLPASIVKTYDLFEGIEKAKEKADAGLEDLIETYVPNKVSEKYNFCVIEPDNRDRSGYAINFCERFSSYDRFFEIWLDAPLGFALMCRNEPSAIVSFINKNDALMIMQLQGVNPLKSEGWKNVRAGFPRISGIDWKSLLVEYVSLAATELGHESVAVQGCRNNSWTRQTDKFGKPRLSLERARAIYDDTAKALGFTKNKDGNWRLNLR